MTNSPRQTLALAYGIEPGDGCRCACCGDSPFDSAGPRRKVLGANFTDFDALAQRSADAICEGCARLMAGRPGDVPPPLRTVSFSCTLDEPVLTPRDRDWWWSLLHAPCIESPLILSWATSRKRHHWLHAGVSSATSWSVGSDHGPIEWEPTPELATSLTAMLAAGVRRAEILSGRYSAPTLSRCRSVVMLHEPTIAAYRNQLILDLALWAAPRVERQEAAESMIDPQDQKAALLLARIAFGSSIRVTDGKMFWSSNGFFVRRVRRFAHKPLPDFVSRLMSECAVGADFGATVARYLDSLSDEDAASISKLIRERPDLLVAIAFDEQKKMKRSKEEVLP